MAVNRFWGQTPVAEFSPMSMQEMMFAPQQLYQREQDLTSKMEAMNEANQTLHSMLGEKAGSSANFESKYQDVLNKISKEGATQKNIDEAKNLRRTYINEVQPMEEFAKQRQDMYHQYLKDKSTGDNILIGKNPLEVSFDEWNKTKTLEPYQAVDRNKLLQHGALVGKQWAEGETRQSVDNFGFLNIQQGFKNADEAMNAYQTDPQFRNWIDDQSVMASKAAGVTRPNEDVLNTIRSGIMTSVVGGVQRHQLPSDVLKGMLMSGSPVSDIHVLDIEPKDAHAEKNWDVIARDPEVKAAFEQETRRRTGGKYGWDDLNNKIQETKPIINVEQDVMSPFHVSRQPGDEFGNLQSIRNDIMNNLKSSSSFAIDMSVMPSQTIVGNLDPKEKNLVDSSMEGVAKDVDRTVATWGDKEKSKGIWGGITNDDRNAIVKYTKAPEDKRKLELKDFTVNMQYDESGKIKGSGQPLAVFWMKWGDKPDENSTVTMALPRNLMDKIRTTQTILAKKYSPQQQQFMNDANSMIDRYYKLEAEHLSQSK